MPEFPEYAESIDLRQWAAGAEHRIPRDGGDEDVDEYGQMFCLSDFVSQLPTLTKFFDKNAEYAPLLCELMKCNVESQADTAWQLRLDS
jgi:hypothetical protein